MTDSIFDPNTSDPNVIVEPAKLQIVLPDSVKELVGEGKKYASVEKALEALTPAQQHIARLEAENEQLRQRSNSAASTEEVLRAIEALKTPSDGRPPTASALDESKVAEIFRRELTARETETLAKGNEAAVKKLLSDKYGEKAEEHYKTRAEELGMSVAALSHLVRTTPSAAIELLGLKDARGNLPPRSRGNINTEAVGQHRHEAPAKSVMFGAKASDLSAAWKAAGRNLPNN